MPAKPKTFDDCLAAIAPDQRAALEKLRKANRAAAPKAEEGISYGLAAFRLDGKPLVAIGATAKHCAFYLMSSTTVDTHQLDLKGFDVSKGTIRFTADKPLPAALVRKLVKSRIAENEALKKPKSVQKKPATADSGTQEVDAFLRKLDHPLKPALEVLRSIIRKVDPAIREGVKWNSPSFHYKEYFATINTRNDVLMVILHQGAKAKDNGPAGLKIADPTGLLKWLGKDRASVTFADLKAVQSKKAAFAKIIRQWIDAIP